jgi:hypothetical protein
MRAALEALAAAAFLVFFGAALGVFMIDVIDAAARKDAATLCKDIVLYVAGLVTSAALETLADDQDPPRRTRDRPPATPPRPSQRKRLSDGPR